MIFAGCKLSINPIKCYWANSFVIQGNNVKLASANPFLGPANARLNINTEKCLKFKKYDLYERQI